MSEKVMLTGIGIVNPKYQVNLGQIMRAAGCFDANFVAISGNRSKTMKINADTQKAYRKIPLQFVSDIKEALPFDCIPIAVELTENAVCISKFNHPKSAFYIFGAEDMTLGNGTLSWCKHVIKIPTHYCLNLAMCVNIVLYDRKVKELKNGTGKQEEASD